MMIYMPIVAALIGLAYMLVKKSWVMKQDAGDGKMKEISEHIYEGALAFLNAEYRLLAIFVAVISVLLFVVSTIVPSTHWLIVVAFILGAFFSAFAGNIGMKIATKTNVRTTQAARTSLPNALKVSFGGGTVMGLGVAGLAVLGLTMFFIFFYNYFMGGVSGTFSVEKMTIVLETLAGFSLGAESIALFARVGGGIYTKAADVGADLVGKVEAGIPEDDPRNPATIADNVGDNVGDVAGMGADLFGSYVATVLAAMVLGNYIIKDMGGVIEDAFGGIGPILLPMSIAGVGIIISLIGTMLVKIKSNDAKESQVMGALNKGNWFSIALVAISCYVLVNYMFNGQFIDNPMTRCPERKDRIAPGFVDQLWHLWDAPGQHSCEKFNNGLLPNAHFFVIMYACDNRESFENVEHHLERVKKFKKQQQSSTGTIYLVSNKIDLPEQNHKVSRKEGLKFAVKHGLQFYEVSSKYGRNVPALWTSLFKEISMDKRHHAQTKQ